MTSKTSNQISLPDADRSSVELLWRMAVGREIGKNDPLTISPRDAHRRIKFAPGANL